MSIASSKGDERALNFANNEFELSSLTIEVVLEKLESAAEKRVEEGFNRFNFAFGVFNTHLIFYMWGVFPQYFWILYFIEAGFFLTYRFFKLWSKKPLNQALHYLDFCWYTNILCFIFLGIVLFYDRRGQDGDSKFSKYFRQQFFTIAWGIACGPLFGALLVTPLPLVFHSNEIMAGVFIHFFPPLQLYILRWNNAVMEEYWPIFWYEEDFNFLSYWPSQKTGIGFTENVLGLSLLFYFIWAVPYMIWQLCIGLDLPRKNRKTTVRVRNSDERIPKKTVFDTVFHFNMRDGQCEALGKYLWKRPKEETKRMIENNDYELRDFFVYMFYHFLGVFISVVLIAWSCSLSKYVHFTWILVIFLMVIWRGANRYVYYSTEMYASLIRKQFAPLLHGDDDDDNGGGGDDDGGGDGGILESDVNSSNIFIDRNDDIHENDNDEQSYNLFIGDTNAKIADP